MKKSRLIVAIVLSLLLSLVFAFSASAETGEAHWVGNTDGTWSYVDYEGNLVKDMVGYWIDGYAYGFDANGIMYTGWVQPYKDDIHSNEEWRNQWYYFEPNGHAANGYKVVDGVGYIFRDNGEWGKDTWICHSYGFGGYQVYYADSQGVVTIVEGTEPGWYNVEGRWYYVQRVYDEENPGNWYFDPCADGVYNIGGVDYVFNGGGYLAYNTFYEYWDDEAVENRTVYADAEGKAIKDGWILHNGGWYYLEYNYLAEGLTEIDGDSYYFYANVMVTNQYVDLHRDYYYMGVGYAKADGKLICGDWRLSENGGWEYYDEQCVRVENCVYNVGGTNYYFDNNGLLGANGLYYSISDDRYYNVDANGVATVKNGWHLTENGRWKYFNDGYQYYGVCTIGGKQYAFEYDYETDEAYLVNTDTYVSEYVEESYFVYYSVNADGTINTTPGWDLVNGSSWVYIGADGTLVKGWVNDGGWYYMNPIMAKNDSWNIDGTLYYFYSDGHYVEITGNGFYRYGDSCIYVENGTVATGWKQINGNWHYFDEGNGYMYANGYGYVDGDKYLFDHNGVMLSGGWIQYGPYWYYADASGKLAADGYKVINGTAYVFDYYGRMFADQTYSTDGYTYLIDKNGNIITWFENTPGWKEFAGNWYYVDEWHDFYVNDFCYIDGEYYAFDNKGKMLTNAFFEKYGHKKYYGADGKSVCDQWIQVDGEWYYAGYDGYLYNHLCEIGGKMYYFKENKLSSGTFLYDDKYVTANSAGEIVSMQDLVEGWNLVNDAGYGKWLYIKDGDFYTGWIGNYYVDGWSGMLCGGTYWIDKAEAHYFFYDNGVCATNGWVKDNNIWYYAKADGKLCAEEWLQLGSTWYYFDYDGWMLEDGIYYIDGDAHLFAEGGAWLGKYEESVGFGEGWHLVDGNWYYINNGDFARGAWQIDGVWYLFDYEGALVSNEFITSAIGGNTHYADANGIICEYTGWKLIDGRWCYFDQNNSVVDGWFSVGGKQYYGDYYYDYNEDTDSVEASAGIATGYTIIDGKLYNFASGGELIGEVTADGWYQVDSRWCYVQNGNLVRDEMVNIGGTNYIFDGSGYMFENTSYQDYEWGNIYLVGQGGAVITAYGWHFVDGEWFFIDEYGCVLTGTHVIDGVSYYFDYYSGYGMGGY